VAEIWKVLTVTVHFRGLSGYFVTFPQVLWLQIYNKMWSSYYHWYLGRDVEVVVAYLYFLVGTEKNHNVPVRGANPREKFTNGYSVKPNPWRRIFEKLVASQLVKKFPAFHRTQRFITMFKRVHHCFNINTIIPYTPWSLKWSPDVSCPHQTPVCSTRTPCMCCCLHHPSKCPSF